MQTTWTDDAQAIGAIVTALGVVVGATIAARYAKRANINVEAECYADRGGMIVAARPTVASIGAFRLHIRSAMLTCVEVRRTAGKLSDGRRWSNGETLADTSVVDGGESLRTMTVFNVGQPTDDVIGWRVSVAVTLRSLIGKGFEWTDRTFVPAPGVPSSHAT